MVPVASDTPTKRLPAASKASGPSIPVANVLLVPSAANFTIALLFEAADTYRLPERSQARSALARMLIMHATTATKMKSDLIAFRR
jgi:hypothetical protein